MRINPEALAKLNAELAGRPPVFIAEPYLAPGTVTWHTSELPRVFVAPDVLAELKDTAARVFAHLVLHEALATVGGWT